MSALDAFRAMTAADVMEALAEDPSVLGMWQEEIATLQDDRWCARSAAGKLATMYMRREVVPKAELDEFLGRFEPRFNVLRREFREPEPDDEVVPPSAPMSAAVENYAVDLAAKECTPEVIDLMGALKDALKPKPEGKP
jgi:hypothetical protein